MDTHAIKLPFATELSSLINIQLTAKFFWRTNRIPARTHRSGRVLATTLRAALSTPSSPAVQAHEAFGSNFSVHTLKDGWTSTGPKVDVEHLSPHVSKSSSWAVSLCNNLEKKVMSWALDNDTCEKEECYLLRDDYAPVEEMAPTANLSITGTIPACMNGIFLRNGPNPRFKPLGGYHWFDGDGMIHGLNMKDGKATYVARFVQTSKLQQEERYGAPMFLKVGDLKGISGYVIATLMLLRKIFGILDGSNGEGTGNTAFVFHNKKLLALYERDRPYRIKVLEDGDLQTIGLEDYGQKLKHPITAHPKIDPITGEMFIFTYGVLAPNLIYRVISKDGLVGEQLTISLPGSVLMHDFAISENYAIFMDLPLLVNPLALATGGFIFKFDLSKQSRLGLLPRNATKGSQIRWFKIPSCYITHTVNAWEEGDEVILTGCRKDGINIDLPEPKYNKEKAWAVGSRLYEYRMNLKTGDVKHRQLSNLCTEFPRINPEYTSRKAWYAYCSVYDETDKIMGLAKYDVTLEPSSTVCRELKVGGNIVGVFHYGPGRAGSEAIFVPRKSGMDGPEDDGYLISFVHDENTETSEAVIIDATTMKAEPVAVVKLPREVPHGFHAYFVTQEQLRQQA